MADPDPFLDEADRHGWRIVGLHHGDVRTRVSEETDCPTCVALWDSWISALMGGMLDGVGPWAGAAPPETPK
jgi:hypothetical protein